eukprot:CAMPEP_0185431024 /NCGR_PEP_ID=MMETSP1365-20130426/17814_1 /TAXON_ID=38817 /ORGANISM="Gephyrocapsa oceanica, Strain RCC1303" /LENGTH=76 /DNA_ID=CAMNT_0028035337 /DNA_START=131 /DNA_END=357 /DNA_ORIENTATION=+
MADLPASHSCLSWEPLHRAHQHRAAPARARGQTAGSAAHRPPATSPSVVASAAPAAPAPELSPAPAAPPSPPPPAA